MILSIDMHRNLYINLHTLVAELWVLHATFLDRSKLTHPRCELGSGVLPVEGERTTL